MDFLRSTSLRVSLIAAALLFCTTIASAAPFDGNAGQLFVVYTLDTGGGPGTLLDPMTGLVDYTQDYVITLALDGLMGVYPGALTANSSPSAGVFLPGFNPNNEFFIMGWANADTDFVFEPMFMANPEDHLLLGGPFADGVVGPGGQEAIINGLRVLGSDPMLFGGVIVENALDFWNRLGGTTPGDQILLPVGMGGEPTNSGELVVIDGFALLDQEIAGFSDVDGLGMLMIMHDPMGKVDGVTYDPPDLPPQVFPEPGIGALMLLAVAGIALRRRRRAA